MTDQNDDQFIILLKGRLPARFTNPKSARRYLRTNGKVVRAGNVWAETSEALFNYQVNKIIESCPAFAKYAQTSAGYSFSISCPNDVLAAGHVTPTLIRLFQKIPAGSTDWYRWQTHQLDSNIIVHIGPAN